MGVEAEGANELRQIICNVSVGHNFPSEQSILLFQGQFSVNLRSESAARMVSVYEEIRGLQEVRFLGQFLNSVPTMAEHALQSVDISNFAYDSGGVHVRRVKHTYPRRCVILVGLLDRVSRQQDEMIHFSHMALLVF